MPDEFHCLAVLASCLLQRFDERVNWDAVISLANRTMTITSLAVAVHSSTPSHVPDDVCTYLEVIRRANLERNARLRMQLEECIKCLNTAEIEPVVIKGAATLYSKSKTHRDGRILVDLDIMVRPEVIPKAIEALADIGYEIRVDGGTGTWPGDPSAHLPTVLERASDAGGLDLQCRPKGLTGFNDIDWLYRNSARREFGAGYAYLPGGYAQIVSLLLHDQFQDGDYWRGLIDLRHLLDMAEISRTPGEIDWMRIRALFQPGYQRRAVDTQILTLSALFGLPDSTALGIGRIPRLQLARRKLQRDKSYLRHLLTFATLMIEISTGTRWDRYGGGANQSRRLRLKHQARELRRIFRPMPLGKA